MTEKVGVPIQASRGPQPCGRSGTGAKRNPGFLENSPPVLATLKVEGGTKISPTFAF